MLFRSTKFFFEDRYNLVPSFPGHEYKYLDITNLKRRFNIEENLPKYIDLRPSFPPIVDMDLLPFNGVYTVTSSTPGSFSFATSTNTSINTSGQLPLVVRLTEVNTTSGSASGGTANVIFDNGATNCTIPVGTTITVTGVTPTKYNGTFTVTGSGPGYVQYTCGTPNPGNITGNGTIVLGQRYGFSGFTADTDGFEFYREGNMTTGNT